MLTAFWIQETPAQSCYNTIQIEQIAQKLNHFCVQEE